MIDTWFVSDSFEALVALREFYPNMIGPERGRAAGDNLPARGNPEFWYVCVRTEEEIVPPQGVSIVSAAEGEAVLGKWA